MRLRLAIMVAAIALSTGAHAITFKPATKPDPFAPGKTCDTPQLSSYGTYVYEWASKYDLIFSPQDYPIWVWRCEASGYVAFPYDFERITDVERPKIAAYLAQANFGPKLASDKGLSEPVLLHLEQVYAVRDRDEAFRSFFMRYMAWQFRAKPQADQYRKRAFDIHLKLLNDGALKEDELADTLYILGFYAYKFGRIDEAKSYFAKIKDVETIDSETKKPRRGVPYLENLAKEVLEGKADDKVRFAND